MSPSLRLNRLHYSFLFEDREGNLWAGNIRNDEGLFRVRERLVDTFSTQQGLPNKNVYPIFARGVRSRQRHPRQRHT